MPPAVRKQPKLPIELAPEPQGNGNYASHADVGAEAAEVQPLFRESSAEVQEDLHVNNVNSERASMADQVNGLFGQEVPIDEDQAVYPESVHDKLSPMEVDQDCQKPPSSPHSSHSRRFSFSANSKRHRREQERMNLDDSGDEIAGMLTTSRVRKAQRPAGIALDGYRGRAGGAGPPGMRDKTSRDSSAQDDSDMPDDAQEGGLQRTTAVAGPSKPTKPKTSSQYDFDDDDDDDDVIVVTSTRAGAIPAQSKTKDEKEVEREARQRAKELREKKRDSERKRPLPTFRHQEHEEEAEMNAAYNARRSKLEGVSIDAEQSPWEMVESFEAPKGRGKRPDWNTVKFWPYNLPFPDRREGEAIVAVAGGCNVRCFRLSATRGISEVWNAVDESANWEKDVSANSLW